MLTLFIPRLSVHLSSSFGAILTATDASGGEERLCALGVPEARVEDVSHILEPSQYSCFRGDDTSVNSPIPGLSEWDAESPARMKSSVALRCFDSKTPPTAYQPCGVPSARPFPVQKERRSVSDSDAGRVSLGLRIGV